MFLARLIGSNSPYDFQPVLWDHKVCRYVHDIRPGVPQKGQIHDVNETRGLNKRIVMVFQDGDRFVCQE